MTELHDGTLDKNERTIEYPVLASNFQIKNQKTDPASFSSSIEYHNSILDELEDSLVLRRMHNIESIINKSFENE